MTAQLEQERIIEALRQERLVFDQRLHQNQHIFRLCELISYVSLLLLVTTISVFLWATHKGQIVSARTGLVFADVMAVVLVMVKISLNRNLTTALQPVTRISASNDIAQSMPDRKRKPRRWVGTKRNEHHPKLHTASDATRNS